MQISKPIVLHDELPTYGDPIILIKGMYCTGTIHQIQPGSVFTNRQCGDQVWWAAECDGGNGRFLQSLANQVQSGECWCC